ncbi:MULTISPECIES: 50S ribosomal protein L31e [Halobaculum]|uniref:Large ribosomal subunit protein eL31 n=2 Tax=Halobaculum TaxID=43927 RepID=A0A8T8W9G3_9EURY|nr:MULTISPECIES: 50S ribosomal protein L31e [Halobaculum]QZP36485.1 50S ribosomal protein L31e [Halobaculum magnesiiphilum]QZY01459.1 50S ribosomal protein L31e [Halobaculum roseum]
MSANDFEERVVTVPLREAKQAPAQERGDRAMSLVREHLAKHFSVDEGDVRLDPAVNETVWERGRQKPPSSVRLRAARFDEDGDIVVEAEPA